MSHDLFGLYELIIFKFGPWYILFSNFSVLRKGDYRNTGSFVVYRTWHTENKDCSICSCQSQFPFSPVTNSVEENADIV